jgi:hypothetical protein
MQYERAAGAWSCVSSTAYLACLQTLPCLANGTITSICTFNKALRCMEHCLFRTLRSYITHEDKKTLVKRPDSNNPAHKICMRICMSETPHWKKKALFIMMNG